MNPLKIGVGLSQQADTTAAGRAAAAAALRQAGLSRAAWALCFFSADHLQGAEALRATLVAETGCQTLCGCSAGGVIAEGREVQSGPALAVLLGQGGGLDARSALLPQEGQGMAAFGKGGQTAGETSLLLVLPDAFQVNPIRLAEVAAEQMAGVPWFGAGATDNGTVGIGLQMATESVRSRSVALLGFSGNFEFAVGITQSCTPLGEPRFITAARENLLLELDGRPALDTYLELGEQLGLEGIQGLAREVLFGFPIDAENPRFAGETCLVRGLSGLDQESGGLVVPFALRSQTALAFMHRSPLQAEEDMRRMVEGLPAGLSGPADFGIYFNCAARGEGLYGRNGVDSAIIAEGLGQLPVIGMFGGFELATALGLPNVYTYTGVLLLLRGRG